MITAPRTGLLPAPDTIRCLFGRTAESGEWPSRHSGGRTILIPSTT